VMDTWSSSAGYRSNRLIGSRDVVAYRGLERVRTPTARRGNTAHSTPPAAMPAGFLLFGERLAGQRFFKGTESRYTSPHRLPCSS